MQISNFEGLIEYQLDLENNRQIQSQIQDQVKFKVRFSTKVKSTIKERWMEMLNFYCGFMVR